MSRYVAWLTVLLVLLAVAAAPVAAQDCTVKAGQAAFEAGDYAEALDIFQCAYDSAPENEQVLLGIGRSALMLNQFSIAANTAEMAANAAGLSNPEYGAQQVDALSAALAETPDSLPIMTQLAHWLWLRARDEEAMPLYEAILEAEPDNVFALTFRASSQAYLGQFEAADAGFAQVFDLAPDNDHAYAIAATTYLDTGDPERAVAYADAAITLAPDDFAGRYVTRGDAYTDLGQDEAALSDYTRALELNPGMYDALIGQANAYLYLGQTEAGLDAVNQALDQNPDSAWALILRGNLYLDLSENELAMADFARADALSPGDVNALIGLGDASYNLGDYAATADYYQQAVAADPDSRYARAGLAAALSALGDNSAGNALADLFQTAPLPVELTATSKAQLLPLDFDTVYFAMVEANAGDTIFASAESVEAGLLDPALIVLDANGQVVAFADNTRDFDAVLEGFAAPAAGTYTIVFGLLDTISGDARFQISVTPAN
jgi:tetratricopeptide (TPR) repeat protein